MNKTIVCLVSLLLGIAILAGLAGCGPAVTTPAAVSQPRGLAPVTLEEYGLAFGLVEGAVPGQAPEIMALLPAPNASGKGLAAAARLKGDPVVVAGAAALRQEAAAAGSATLTVQNESAYTVCYLYLSPTTSDEWGDDWLGEDEVLAPGATRRFTLAAGEYDAIARDCNRQVIAEVRGGTIAGRTTWTIAGEEEEEAEAGPTVRPGATVRPAATPRPVALDQFLCCGRTAGETRIWGISYPGNWEVTLLPENPDYFLGAMFVDPRSSMRILILPSGWTPMGTAMDTGDVDQYLDALAAARAQQSPGFREFYREPLAGVPGRVWAGTWPQGGQQYWESVTAMVTAMPTIENMPRGALMLLGLSAESSEWAQVRDIYERMLGSLQVQVISTGPAYEAPQPGPSDDPVEQSTGEAGAAASSWWELVFCARQCDWEWIDINNQPAGTLWDCSDGCRGYLSKVPCTEEWCR